jgi:hypothetical protein
MNTSDSKIVDKVLALPKVRDEASERIVEVLERNYRNGSYVSVLISLNSMRIREIVGDGFLREVVGCIEGLEPSQAFRGLKTVMVRDYLVADPKRCLRFFKHKLLSNNNISMILSFGATFKSLFEKTNLPIEMWGKIFCEAYTLELSAFSPAFIQSIMLARTPRDIRQVFGCEVEVPNFMEITPQ